LAASLAPASGPAWPSLGLVDKAPEAVHVLAQLAKDEVAAVAAKVGQLRIAGPGQDPARIVGRRHRRGLGELPVLVLVAEDELARAHGVQAGSWLAGGPELRDQRLGDPVAEAEGLRGVQKRGVEAPHLGQAGSLERGSPRVPVGEGAEPRLVLGVQQQHGVDGVGRTAPAPLFRSALTDVAKDAATRVRGHPARELVREPGEGTLREAETSQPWMGERDMHGLRPAPALGGGHLAGQGAEPGPGRRRVVDAQQHEDGGP
jgi:hypothetical protein